MPKYAYACTACGHEFDEHQSFTDDALTDCPECSGRLRKKFGAVGVVFKGSGFYRTDSRNGSGGGVAGANGSKDGGSKDSGSKDGGSAGGAAKDGGPAAGSKDSGSGSATADKGTSSSTSTSGSGTKSGTSAA